MVKIDKDSHRPFFFFFVIGIKEDILQGILEPGDQIPSVREMAKILLMNPNTISKAYKVLESEQVLVTVKGKGTFVKQVESRPRDLRRIEELQQKFNELVIEAKHLQVNETEIKQWLKEAEAKLGGNEA